MMTREEMLTEVIKKNGFEHAYTIWFAELMEDETITDEMLESAMEIALA